jgi:hypothetical protein
MITAQATPSSKVAFRVGHVVGGLAVLFLIFDAGIKVLQLAPAIEATTQLGYAVQMVRPLGLIELACIALYAFPRTAALGAIVLTGYLGGAIATQVHNNSPLFSLIFPVIIGALIWGGLFLRDARLRELLPLRK